MGHPYTCGFIFLASNVVFFLRIKTLVKMGDRSSDLNYDGKVEDAKVAMMMNVKTLNQLSSSAQAAQQNCGKKAILDLGNAMVNV